MSTDTMVALSLLAFIFIAVIVIMITISFNEKRTYLSEYRQYVKDYEFGLRGYKVPNYYDYVTIIGQSEDQINKFDLFDYKVWREDDVLYFYPLKIRKADYLNNEFFTLSNLNLEMNKIDVNSIISFRIESKDIRKNGQVPQEYSLEGAVIGGMIAGGLGAYLGSQINQDNKKVEYYAKECVLFYIDKNNRKQRLIFNGEDAEVLNQLLPEKEIEFYEKYSMEEFDSEEVDEYSVPGLIREYAKLRDEGLISAEEFEQKKQQLLGLGEVSEVNEE